MMQRVGQISNTKKDIRLESVVRNDVLLEHETWSSCAACERTTPFEVE